MFSSAEINQIIALLIADYRVKSVVRSGRAIVEFEVSEAQQGEASAIAEAAMKDSQGALVEQLARKLGLLNQA